MYKILIVSLLSLVSYQAQSAPDRTSGPIECLNEQDMQYAAQSAVRTLAAQVLQKSKDRVTTVVITGYRYGNTGKGYAWIMGAHAGLYLARYEPQDLS